MFVARIITKQRSFKQHTITLQIYYNIFP